MAAPSHGAPVYTALRKKRRAADRRMARRAGAAYIPAMTPTGTPAARPPRRRLEAVEAHSHDHCEGHGRHLDNLRLTPGRQVILDMLCEAGRPLGAYEMIDRLADASGRRPAPISVYRALDYLLENGLVHRLATRNAYLACGHRHERSDPVVFLICDACGRAEEATSAGLGDSLSAVASGAGFGARTAMIELAGVCADCRAGAPATQTQES
jgi:Fur family zinc uptake transcriptional regulator